MKTKALIAATVAATLLALVAWSSALAQAQRQTPKTDFGSVQSVDCAAGSLTLETKQGSQGIKMTLQTQVRSAGTGITCQNIAQGDRVAITASEEAGVRTAITIMVVPSKPATAHIAGVVSTVQGDSITVVDRDGKTSTVQLTPGMVAPAPGQMVILVGQREADKLVARSSKKAEDVVAKVQDDLTKVTSVQDQDNLKARLELGISQHLSVLSQAVEKAPEAAKNALRQALENSSKGYVRALESVGKSPEARLEGVLQSASATSLAVTYSGNRSITFKRTATEVKLSGGADTLAAGMWVMVDYDPVSHEALRLTARPPDMEKAAKVDIRGPIEKMDVNTWVIGGATVSLAKDTKKVGLEPKVGLFAKATVIGQPDGSHVAVEIVVSSSGGISSDHVVFEGLIEKMGTTSWTVGGREVQVAKDTVKQGTPKIGGWAQVTAKVQPNGSLVALSVDLTVSAKQGPSFQGIIQVIGTDKWVVSGITIQLAPDAKVEGTPTVGARVQFTGGLQPDGSFLARSVSVKGTDVGAGQATFTGTVERTSADTWVVSGVTLTIGVQTRIKGNPAVGDIVTVEATTLPTGTKVAISIESVAAGSRAAR